MTLRILLADDHQIVREGLSALLQQEDDFEVVAGAANGREAIRLAEEHVPDVVVMDIAMPDLNGVDATRRIVERVQGVRVVVLSMHRERHFVTEVLRAGAAAYVQKGSRFDELAAAIRAAAGGHFYLSPGVTDVLVHDLLKKDEAANATALSVLTPREREVLQLLAEGQSAKEAGGTLGISPKTVYAHRQSIMRKVGAGSTADLVRYAINEGLVAPSP